MNLRRMRWWDVADVADLEAELFPVDPWPTEAFWAELALGEERSYLVAEDDNGRLAGYAGVSCPRPPDTWRGAEPSDAEVMTIATAPWAQGRGLGRRLVAALVDTAQTRGAGRVLLEVRADNPAAQHLYAATGFAQIGVRERYYRGVAGPDGAGPKVDALVLSRSLTRSPDGAPEPGTVRP